jgi:hypothetical protein
MTSATEWAEVLRDRLVGDAWGNSHRVLKGVISQSSLLTSAEIEDWLEASLLQWPYFTVLKQGEQPPVGSYTTVRDVIGQRRGGFADPAAISRLMAQGATLKLNQLSDWHRPTRDLARRLEEFLPTVVASYVFWTPAEQRGMLPHRDAAHVIASIAAMTELVVPRSMPTATAITLTTDPGHRRRSQTRLTSGPAQA